MIIACITINYKSMRSPLIFLFLFFISSTVTYAQQRLLFGTVKSDGLISQARFETDTLLESIVYAPYGITPVAFTTIVKSEKQLSFTWRYNGLTYHCSLMKGKDISYEGRCTNDSGRSIQLLMRDFNEEDARLQGNWLPASKSDLDILDRALSLLNQGSNWSRSDNRVCDNSTYPYRWSLFCALHQASIDVDGEYRHLRPAIQAVRQAIEQATAGRKFSHMLQDFNKEAQTFSEIAGVLNRAKQIISEKIKDGK
jgi:hypothetical protein